MKSNNKGWGLASFLIFLFIFFVALIVLVIVGNHLSGNGSREVIESIEELGD